MSVCERESWGAGGLYVGDGEGDPKLGSGLGEMSEVGGQRPGLEREEDEWIGGRGNLLKFSSPQP